MPDERDTVTIRELRADDVEAVIALWHETKLDAYPYLPLEQSRTIEEDRRFFREVILPGSVLWVGFDRTALAGFLALQDSYIDRLYIHPAHQRRGVGSALMEQAKALSPAGLELHTHQKNTQARAFYERHGFTIAKLGISPPPESEPDIEYHWRPPHA